MCTVTLVMASTPDPLRLAEILTAIGYELELVIVTEDEPENVVSEAERIIGQ